MVLAPKLDIRQSQSLVMTPQLMQSIRLLQMTQLELEQFIDAEMEKNPLLELAEAPTDEAAVADLSLLNDAAGAEARSDEEEWQQSEAVDEAAALSEFLDGPAENIYSDDSLIADMAGPAQTDNAHGTLGENYQQASLYDIEQAMPDRPSLRDHIAEQVNLSFSSSSDRFLALALADALDESGYLRLEVHALAPAFGVEIAVIDRVLQVLQGFDPPGLFARDLSECLAIQLELQGRLDPAMLALVQNLDLLAKRDFATLARICGVGQSEIPKMLAHIQTLDPKPGAQFDISVAETITPDAVVALSAEDEWIIELNPAVMPRLIVNNDYYAKVSATAAATEVNFLTDCMQNANWLVRSLDQRAKTMLRVFQEVVRQQDGFLRMGIRELKPLNLKTIAEAVGMHESTISRVTANKFIQTPRGVFELRYFFTVSLGSSEGGDAHAAESVRHRIRQMIDTERPDDILSDDAIVDMLKKEGVEIARRTVAKYRESLNISSSVQRRREKRALK